ncbi:MAG: VOC family protein [Chloroflexi bacterium]|nr:VOC family protein [Chloroflexota bacterium]
MPVTPIPEGYHTVTPYLVVPNAPAFMQFLQAAFGAQETVRMTDPSGRIAHAEVTIGDSVMMLAEASDTASHSPAMIHLYVDDCDAAYQRALVAGAISLRAPTDQFYGDRSAGVKDAFGNQWWLATHVEDVPPDELQRRAEARSGQPA